MDNRTLGLLIVALGAAAVVIGLLVMAGGLGWFGRLPGDVRWGSGGVRVFVPITVSVVLSLVLWLVRRFT